MILPSFSTIAATLLWATHALGLPVDPELDKRAQNVIIGYRTVSAAQGERYNQAGTLTNDPNLIGTQIGAGVYTTPNRGGWPGSASSMYCVIMADSAALRDVYKVQIPEFFNEERIWFKGQAAVDGYIKNVVPQAVPNKTIRISKIDGGSGALQIVIPPGLLNSNGGGLGITASCKKTEQELPSVNVAFQRWPKLFGSL
ncbi:hypothetical protein CI238_09714 [Colletotrichum incanum]|uniref:Uncharacterized protein n=1 Tax=Colletotrichum incanum TaxID=1573173 RepID=A0A161WK94_COLIC|nr:hypothetical protein CI238_09714 [Colletotrichum incanum]OHX00165.1 hypothetical protein CSPAE12_01081 [Colletotrichum incanum]